MAQNDSSYQARLRRVLGHLQRVPTIWGLKTATGWANWRDPDMLTQPIILFWSSQDAMRAVRDAHFAGYQEVSIPRETFFRHWLGELARQKIRPGFDYTLDQDGEHFDPNDLLHQNRESVRIVD